MNEDRPGGTGASVPGPHPPSRRVTGVRHRRVLFLCVRNSARSQMAEAMARAVAPEGTVIWSAGVDPAPVHPVALEVLREVGIDASAQRSKHVDQVPWREADLVVTVCGEGGEVCPAVGPEVHRVHWPLPDPAVAPEPERLAAFRATREQLRWRIAALWPSGD
jgi:arsenate reductase